jgi:hypothetical protein
MAKKRESKGNILDFINDAASDPELMEKMMGVIKVKGKGWTGEKLLTEFHKLHYYGVSRQDCDTLLVSIKRIKDPSAWDWTY